MIFLVKFFSKMAMPTTSFSMWLSNHLPLLEIIM